MNQTPKLSPPKWADKFLEWYCSQNLIDEIQGDLYEQFYKDSEAQGAGAAKRKFVWNVIRFFRPSSFKPTKFSTNSQVLLSYVKVAVRVSKREKGHTLTNALGLTLGLTCSLIIYLWVLDELSYNRWPDDLERIHYVYVNMLEPSGSIETWENTPYPLREVLQEQYPAIEKAASIDWGSTLSVPVSSDFVNLAGHYGSPEIFDIFSIPFSQGNAGILYRDQASIAISEKAAKKLFGDNWQNQNHVGKLIRDKKDREFILSGIFKDLPPKSTLKFDFIIPYEYSLSFRPWNKKWGNYNNKLYVKLAPGYNAISANENIRDAIIENKPFEGDTPIFLHPFSKNHLHTKAINGQISGGRIEYVILLSLAATLILLLAFINFASLNAAQSLKRTKEAGIRKILGAQGSSLRIQLIIESMLTIFSTYIFSITSAILLLPLFNDLSGKTFDIHSITPTFLIQTLCLVLILGVFSGLYPAIFLASLAPIKALKGLIKRPGRDLSFRRGLIIFQFVITTVMIITSITIFQQLQYISSKNTGMERDNVILMNLGDVKQSERASFKQEMLSMPGIASMAYCNYSPTSVNTTNYGINWNGKTAETEVGFAEWGITPDIIPLMGMEIVSGRNFNPDIKSDSSNFLINEAAAEVIGKKDIIGLELDTGHKGKIIGVVKNFNNQSLHMPIKPMIITWENSAEVVCIKAQSGHSNDAITSIEKIHNQYIPERNFKFTFLNEVYLKQYQNEQLLGKISLYFTIAAITISCLGLLSLVAFTTELKTKEIGIRKVLGAPLFSLFQLISKEFLTLILVALAISLPVGYWITSNWLEQFEFRTDLGPGIFLIAAGGALFIAALTIYSHTLRAATKNPVDSLRDE